MKNLRLLIVDDEEASRYGIRRALESFGYEIAEADSAEAARGLMTNAKFDLLLLDVNLPGISGLEFLAQLQTEAEDPAELPLVIIITAHGSERMAVQAVKSGAYDYVSSLLSSTICDWSSRTPSRRFSFAARINHCGGALRSKPRSVARCSETLKRCSKCAQ